MSSEKFVNRHGHRMRVEASPEPSLRKKDQPKAAVASEQAPVRSKRSWPRLRISKRVILPLVILVVVGIITMLVTADSVKRGYERQTAAMKRSVFERSKQSASSETATETIVSDLRRSLQAPAGCTSSGLDVVSWYGPAKAAREECQSTASAYQKLQRSLDDMLAVAQYMKQTRAQLGNAISAPSSGGFGGINEYTEAWTQAADGLGKLTPPESLRLSHQTLVGKTTAVRDAWTALRDANASQKSDEFRAAEIRLNEQYTAFRGSADGIQDIVNSIQSSIMQYVKQLSA